MSSSFFPPTPGPSGEYLPVGLYRTTLDGKILECNRAFAEMLGFSRTELLAKNALDLYADPEDRQTLLALVAQRGVVRDFEVQLRRRDGQPLWAELHLAAVGHAGRAVQLEGAVVDITQRKVAEAALWESDQRLELAVSRMQAVLWSTDRELVFTLSIGAGLARLGLRPNQVVGQSLYEFFGTQDRAHESIAPHLRALRGETVRFETQWGGGHYQVLVQPLRSPEGAILGTSGVAQDVTEEHQAQESYRELVERVRVVVWRGDPETLRFTYVAPQAEDLLGYPARLWLEKPDFWVEHLHPDDRERVLASCREASLEGRAHEMEYRLQADDGRSVWVRDIVYPVIEGARVTENVGVLIDVTAQRRGEDLRRALLEVSRRAQAASDLESLCAALHEVVGTFMPAQNFYIALRDEETGRFSFPYFRDEQDPEPPADPSERGLTAWVLRHGEPLLATPDVFADLERRGEVESVGTASLDWLGVPLRLEGHTLGVLALQSYSPTVRYREEERDLLVFISDHVARALERERARAALSRSVSLLHSTLEATADGILVVNRQGRVVSYNRRFAELWGIPDVLLERRDDEELIGFVLDQLQSPDVFLAKVRELYAKPLAESVDVLAFKDGRVLVRNSRPQILDGEAAGRVWSFREVSRDVQDALLQTLPAKGRSSGR